MKTKIDWCDEVWNPVWGCKRGCAFGCYAERFHRRFAKKLGITNPFEKPTWIESNFQKKLPNKPKRIFVGSMSDIGHWKGSWIEKVLKKIEDYPQHTFLFLTKDYLAYIGWEFPENCWLGSTVTGQEPPSIQTQLIGNARYRENINFVSFEPLLAMPNLPAYRWIKWAIIGGLNPKPIHSEEWVDRIIAYAKIQGFPVFLKDNLHYPKKIQEFPE